MLRVTTNDAYQSPTESRVMRTLDGSDGSFRDHTTGIVTPFGKRNRPSWIRKLRRVYSRVGDVAFRDLNFGRLRPFTANDESSARA